MNSMLPLTGYDSFVIAYCSQLCPLFYIALYTHIIIDVLNNMYRPTQLHRITDSFSLPLLPSLSVSLSFLSAYLSVSMSSCFLKVVHVLMHNLGAN